MCCFAKPSQQNNHLWAQGNCAIKKGKLYFIIVRRLITDMPLNAINAQVST